MRYEDKTKGFSMRGTSAVNGIITIFHHPQTFRQIIDNDGLLYSGYRV